MTWTNVILKYLSRFVPDHWRPQLCCRIRRKDELIIDQRDVSDDLRQVNKEEERSKTLQPIGFKEFRHLRYIENPKCLHVQLIGRVLRY